MKKAPDPVAIHEAELRFFQSAQLVSGGFCRVRDAFRNSMARPSTMVKVAGLAGLFCFWLARRMRLKSPTPLKSLLNTIGTSTLGLMLAAFLRYGIRRLQAIFR